MFQTALTKGTGGLLGQEPWSLTVRGGAVTKGTIVMPDLAGSDAAVSSLHEGAENGVFGNVLRASAAGEGAAYPHFVATEDVADDSAGEFKFYGQVKALVNAQNPNIAKGDRLVLDGITGDLRKLSVANGVLNQKVVAIALEAATTNNALISVFFNGAGFAGAHEDPSP